MRVLTWCLALLMLLVAGCAGNVSGGQMTPEQAEKAISARAQETLQAFRAKDWEKVSGLVHPDKGIRFSPYAFVRTGADRPDRQFTAEHMKSLYTEKALLEWGIHDGSGEPIRGTFADYYARFVYDVDFVTAPQVRYNSITQRGNTTNNIRATYPDAIVVEYHFPGFDPKYGGMDWRSLYLTFELKGKTWYLTGVIHDQWTI